jgi:hypothetical protein
MFLGARGGGMRRESVWEWVPEVRASKSGKQCQLSLGLAFGRVWGPFWMGKNVFRLYYTLTDIFYHSFGYWGRDGMDASGALWMTCAIYRKHQP